MNFLNSSKFVSRSLIGAVGLSVSAIAFLGSPDAAKAQNIPAGSEFFISPAGGSTFIFDSDKLNAKLGLGLPPGQEIRVPLQGKPIPGLLGKTDTVVERKQDCTFVAGSCTVDIEMTELSLETIQPFTIPQPGFGDYEIEAMLDPQTPTLGQMTINDNGTFSSFLNVFYIAKFTPIGNARPIGDFHDDLLLTNPPTGEPLSNWTPIVPKNAVCVIDGVCANNQFFPVGPVRHEKGSPTFPEGHTTILETVPEPSTVLMSVLGLGAMLGLKKKKESNG